jgi:hypothetical protein
MMQTLEPPALPVVLAHPAGLHPLTEYSQTVALFC